MVSEHRDPVDSALEMLRSESWTAQPLTPELENQFMQNMHSTRNGAGFTRRRMVLAGLALLAVGGATFAATGGISAVRGWLVHLEINGEPLAVELDENGQAEIRIEQDDGSVADIAIQQTQSDDGTERSMEVNVTKTGPGIENEDTITVSSDAQQMRQMRRVRVGANDPAGPALTLKDLGDTEASAEWTQNGQLVQLFLLPGDDGASTRLLTVTSSELDAPVVAELAVLPRVVATDEFDVNVEPLEGGALRIGLIGDGQKMQFEIRSRMVEDGNELPENLDMDSAAGTISIRLDTDE